MLPLGIAQREGTMTNTALARALPALRICMHRFICLDGFIVCIATQPVRYTSSVGPRGLRSPDDHIKAKLIGRNNRD